MNLLIVKDTFKKSIFEYLTVRVASSVITVFVLFIAKKVVVTKSVFLYSDQTSYLQKVDDPTFGKSKTASQVPKSNLDKKYINLKLLY